MHLIFVDYRKYFSLGNWFSFNTLNCTNIIVKSKKMVENVQFQRDMVALFVLHFISFCVIVILSQLHISCCQILLKLPCGTLIVNYLVMLTCICWHSMCYILKYVVQHFLIQRISPTNSQRLCQKHKLVMERVSVTNFHLIYPFHLQHYIYSYSLDTRASLKL